MMTIIRDVNSNRQDFVFFVDRLATLLVEKALEVLPYSSKTVVTPVGVEYHGQQSEALVSNTDVFSMVLTMLYTQCICGVTIQRSWVTETVCISIFTLTCVGQRQCSGTWLSTCYQ